MVTPEQIVKTYLKKRADDDAEEEVEFKAAQLVTDLDLVVKKLINVRDSCRFRAKQLENTDPQKAATYEDISKSIAPLLAKKDNIFIKAVSSIRRLERVH